MGLDGYQRTAFYTRLSMEVSLSLLTIAIHSLLSHKKNTNQNYVARKYLNLKTIICKKK